MGLMTGTGPFGREPAGTFNFEPPPPGRALYLEPTPKRIRVVVGGETIADSRRAMLLHESGHQPIYYFPPEDVRSDVLEPSDRHTHCPKKGDASYHTIRVGPNVVEGIPELQKMQETARKMRQEMQQAEIRKLRPPLNELLPPEQVRIATRGACYLAR